MNLSDRVNSIQASQSLQMASRAKQMQSAGIDVISMSLGEPDFDTPEHIRRAAQEAIDRHWSHYGPVAGIPSLREAISRQQSAISRQPSVIDYTGADVIVSVGAKMAIYNAIQTVVNPGDEVIIPMPSWVSYTEMVKLAQGTVVAVLTRFEDNYCLTPEQLQSVITPRTRMLILCSPNNPTGSVYSAEQLDALVAVLREHPQIVILSDEIYNQLVYDRPAVSLASYAELAQRLIIVNGVSKSYAMTGYRIGWLLCKNADFIAACTRLQGQQITCATMVAQKAAEAALTGDQTCVQTMREIFAERRELICRLAAQIPGFRFTEPQGAFYLFPDVSAIGTGDEVVELLLEKAHVACVSGSAFGCPECIRLSYAISTDLIIEALRRISVFLASK
ncbi:MAG: pyridoxal phosphate-dependent aminotransferase [Paludibacteraceae bacterium]|nr:pyridoxal phosphate-dependent aminotransferase [Paludibacteraceae bacterium]